MGIFKPLVFCLPCPGLSDKICAIAAAPQVLTKHDLNTRLFAVDARWFGGTYGAASNFQIVSNCSVLQLTSNGGHGTTFYTGSVPDAPNGCTVSRSLRSNQKLIKYSAVLKYCSMEN